MTHAFLRIACRRTVSMYNCPIFACSLSFDLLLRKRRKKPIDNVYRRPQPKQKNPTPSPRPEKESAFSDGSRSGSRPNRIIQGMHRAPSWSQSRVPKNGILAAVFVTGVRRKVASPRLPAPKGGAPRLKTYPNNSFTALCMPLSRIKHVRWVAVGPGKHKKRQTDTHDHYLYLFGNWLL